MTDSIQVFKPGFRVEDGDGELVSGAVIYFFDSETTTPRAVYSDYALSASLGTSVTCNSEGVPTSNGNAVVEIYTGNTPYKVQIKDADGALIPGFSWDKIKGALDTSGIPSVSDFVASFPITNSSSNQTPVNADKAKYYNLNCSGGDVSVTIAAASTLDNGWSIKVRHDGTANQILFVGTGGDLFKIGGRAGVAAFAGSLRGQVFTITCDQTGFKVEQSSPALFNALGVIAVADYLSAPPVSPEAGARYLVSTSPTGAWSTFAQYDIAEASGQGTWFNITPPTNCGWLAYHQGEKDYYLFAASAWATLKSGMIINRVYAEYATNADITAVIPLDDTIPQISEGTEIVTASITPKKTTSRIRVRFDAFGAGNAQNIIAALFQDAIANALRAVAITAAGTSSPQVISLVFEHSPATTSSVTYRIRVGSASGTVRLNGGSLARFFGGVAAATLVLEEIQA